MKAFKRFIALLLVFFCSFTTIAFADNSSDFHSSVKKMLETLLKEFDSYQIEGNDSGYYICISFDGIMDAIAAVMVGQKSHDDWQKFINVTVDYANSIQNFLNVAGVQNPNLLFVVIDDCGFNIPLLIICNGEIIYDFMPLE